MGVKGRNTVYPFAEMIEVESEGITSIDLLAIPGYTLIEKVIVRVKTAAVGTANLIIGDDDDADGFIVAADAVAAAGTVYGDVIAEVGDYLKATHTHSVSHAACSATSAAYSTLTAITSTTGPAGVPSGKLYTTGDKEVKFVLSAAPTTQGVYQVFVFGKRFAG